MRENREAPAAAEAQVGSGTGENAMSGAIDLVRRPRLAPLAAALVLVVAGHGYVKVARTRESRVNSQVQASKGLQAPPRFSDRTEPRKTKT